MFTPTNPRILICRLSHIGDCILTLPMVREIKREYPSAFIGWAVEAPSHQLLELHPEIDQLIMVPKGWIKQPSQWARLSGKLRAFNFDVSIDPQGITKSAMLGWISGAKQRIGIQGKWGRELSSRLNNDLVLTQTSHLVDRSLELTQRLGTSRGDVDFGLPVCGAAEITVQKFLDQLLPSDHFAVINPGASWASKRWELDRFAGVANYIWDRYQIPSIVTWAGDEELAMAEKIHQLAPAATRIAPQTSLREFAALAHKAKFFIGCDTGPMHIASAMGCRCVGLYGPTRPEESGAYGKHHFAVQKWYQAGSSRQRRTAENVAMRDIQVADVIPAIDSLLCSGGSTKEGLLPHVDVTGQQKTVSNFPITMEAYGDPTSGSTVVAVHQ